LQKHMSGMFGRMSKRIRTRRSMAVKRREPTMKKLR
jgi:hypothetical protein